jgi:hypothetical protein
MPTETPAKFVKRQVKKVSATADNKPATPPEPKLTKTGAPRTVEWLSANGHDLKKGDRFTTKDAKITGHVAGRFTKPIGDARVPHISCDDPKGFTGKCFRAPAGDLLYVTEPVRKPRAVKA